MPGKPKSRFMSILPPAHAACHLRQVERSATTIHSRFTGSRLISEVNSELACLVLGLETTWELHVL